MFARPFSLTVKVGALLVLAAILLGSGQYRIASDSLGTDPAYGLANPPPTPLKIGLLFPYTGHLSDFGPELENGANLAAQHINSAGGILGQPIQLITRDSGTSPSQAATQAVNLIEKEGVSAIVGAVASSVTISVAESVTIPNQVVLISPSSTSRAITTFDDNDYLFRTVPSDVWQGRALAELAVQQGFQSSCSFYLNDPYSQDISDRFAQSFGAFGRQVLATVAHEDGLLDYWPGLKQCTQSAPEVLAAISYPSAGEVFLVQAIQNSLVGSFVFSGGMKSQEMIDAVDQAVGAGALDGTFGMDVGVLMSEVLRSQYEAKYDEPISFVGEAYSAVVLLALAAESADSTDSTAIRDALRTVASPPGTDVAAGSAGIAQALQLIGIGTDINYLGHTGCADLDLDAAGDVTRAVYEKWTIQDSQIQSAGCLLPLEPVGDTDGDGCADVNENLPKTEVDNGGGRDYLDPWDWYDVNYDGVIDLLNDILGVISHYQPIPGGAPPYDITFDRGPTAGPNAWNMTAPDGVIDLLNDILGVIIQFDPDGCT